MPSEASRGASPALVTLDAIRAEHGRLLELPSDGVPAGTEYVREVRSFVDRLVADAVYFDEMSERRTIQGYLDHWIGELSTRYKPEERSALTQLEQQPFSVDALRALQDTVVNPFATVAADLGASTDQSGRSATVILKWIEERTKAGGIRCQEGLLKEIASQVAADPEGPTLLAFCLWHLFEDPATRIGNKIRRREGEVAFSCSAYLVEKTAWLYEQQGESEQRAMMRALLAFSPDDSPGGRERAIPRRKIASSGGDSSHQFVLYAQDCSDLEPFLLDARMVFPAPGDRLALVHRTLLTHWPHLAAAKGQQAERKRWIRRLTIGGSLVAAAVVVTSLGWKVYADRQVAIAVRGANAATVGGGVATGYVRTMRAYYGSNPERTEEENKAALVAATWPAREHHMTQLTQATTALEARAGPIEKTIGNDALTAAIGFLVQAGALGHLEPLPTVTACAPARPCLRVGRDVLAIPKIPDSAGLGPEARISHDGTRLVQVWSMGKQLVLGVYRIGRHPAGNEATAGPPQSSPIIEFLRSVPLDLACEAKDTVARFSGDGRIVSVTCPESAYGDWSLVDIATDRAPTVWHSPGLPVEVSNALKKKDKGEILSKQENELLNQDLFKPEPKNCNGILTLPARTGAIYPTSLGEGKGGRSYVTTNESGFVGVWAEDSPCPRAQFSSNFVRLDTVGAPAQVAFQESDVKRYAIYRYSEENAVPPLIRLYAQSGVGGAELITEHYPPLGTPVSMRFTPTGKCLEVQIKLKKPLTQDKDAEVVGLRYYISTEAAALTALTKALGQDLAEKENIVAAQQMPDWRRALRHYSAAVDEQCGVTQSKGS